MTPPTEKRAYGTDCKVIQDIPNILENFIKFATIGTNPPILT